MIPEPEQLIAGRYRLLRPLARGGMGSVWVARHVDLEVEVAIKFRASTQQLDPKAELRFKREAQAAAQLKSPHVVHIHDYGIDDGTPYIAMELLEGEDLGDYLTREQCLSLTRALELIRQAGKALTRAHASGIVHRDIKPSNLFLARHGEDEVLKVLDFGIAKEQTTNGDEATTSVGVILGSPTYMSPEQARGSSVDQRSDVYSLAAVLFRMLTGVPPFVGESSQDVIIKICTEALPKASSLRADLALEVDQFFERALARKASDRFASIALLIEAFEHVVRQTPNALHRPESSRVPLGRTSDTESLIAPTIQIPESKRGYRWALPIAGAALLLLAVIWWTRVTTPTRQATAPSSATAEATTAAAEPAPASPPASPQSNATSAAATAPTTSVKLHETKVPARVPRKPSEQPSHARTANDTPKSTPEQVVDPVFGIAVPAGSQKNPP